MIDVSAIGGLISSFKAMSDITQAMMTLRDGQMMQSKVIELQGAILAAQQRAMQAHIDYTVLAAKIRLLESEDARITDWSEEKKRICGIWRGHLDDPVHPAQSPMWDD